MSTLRKGLSAHIYILSCMVNGACEFTAYKIDFYLPLLKHHSDSKMHVHEQHDCKGRIPEEGGVGILFHVNLVGEGFGGIQ